MQIRLPTLALKTGRDVTTSPKKGYQRPNKKPDEVHYFATGSWCKLSQGVAFRDRATESEILNFIQISSYHSKI